MVLLVVWIDECWSADGEINKSRPDGQSPKEWGAKSMSLVAGQESQDIKNNCVGS